MRKAYRNNDTFSFGVNTRFNSCVGENGTNDIETYEFGYTHAVKLLIDSLKLNSAYVDPIIYPLIFCARHSIELFLKKTVRILEELNTQTGNSFIPINVTKTHDLKRLWEHFIELSKFDERLLPCVNDLNPYIIDYYDIDLTGEVFRYPYDQDQTHHLDDFSCINILVFEKRFSNLSDIKERITYHLEYLEEEYKQKTYTGKINRAIIELISHDLPARNTWNDSKFCEVKDTIKEKYKISSNTLVKIIRIIDSHREFSSNIGVVLPVTDLLKNDYDIYRAQYFDYQKNIKKQMDRVQYKNDITNTIINSINSNAISAIRAFYEIGFHRIYSEEYDLLITHFSKKDPFDIIFFDLLDGGRNIELIEKGMACCGQLQLISNDKNPEN